MIDLTKAACSGTSKSMLSLAGIAICMRAWAEAALADKELEQSRLRCENNMERKWNDRVGLE